MINTNMDGTQYMTKALLPFFVDQQKGLMINISLLTVSDSYSKNDIYKATKAFLIQFSLKLRADLVKKGVQATSIELDLAETVFSVPRFKGDQKKADSVCQSTHSIQTQALAEMCYWITTLPEYLNLNCLDIMTRCPGLGPFQIIRDLF